MYNLLSGDQSIGILNSFIFNADFSSIDDGMHQNDFKFMNNVLVGGDNILFT